MTPDRQALGAATGTRGRRRLLSLDVLRGVAILLVLCDHQPFPCRRAGVLAPGASMLQQFGWTGVDLFFVLSGFLIGGLLFHELRSTGIFDVRRFYIRRILRIWPSYYLLVAAAILLLVVRSHGQFSGALRIMMPNLLHVQNYWPGDRPIRQTWSLAVEEHFYAALPLLVWLAARRGRAAAVRPRGVVIGAAMVLAACAAYRACVLTRLPFAFWTHDFATHVRVDSLAFGVLLAYGYHYAPARFAAISRFRGPLILLGLALVSPMLFVPRNSPFVFTAGYVLLYLGYGALLVGALGGPSASAGRKAAPAAARLVAWVGYYSYTIYLWMAFGGVRPVEALMARLPHMPGAAAWCLAMAIYLPLAVGAGVAAGRIVDGPVQSLRNRLYPARSTPLD
ncbi:MAG TPA: acyltransferase [Chthonomonadaceae bacterium]|nr:acyltransferase [Chthonomonadaceae bacterium]